MKLDFLEDMTGGGKYKNVVSENLVRLYDFDQKEAKQLQQAIIDFLKQKFLSLNISELPFIESIECHLIFNISDTDEGIMKTAEKNVFHCNLIENGFIAMCAIMNPFIEYDSSGYNWLCEVSDDNIDFLFSPGGTW